MQKTLLEISAEVLEIYQSTQARAADSATIKTLADHCNRLLREKETLVKMIGFKEIERQLAQASGFEAAALPSEPAFLKEWHPFPVCSFAATHRPGIPCRICGYGATASGQHTYDGPRCTRCQLLRAAIEAQALPCVPA